MRICFVNRGTLGEFKQFYDRENAENGGGDRKKADIVVFGFGGKTQVSYERELKGETRFFEDAALLSKREKNLVVCGCITDNHSHLRKSAAVAENGRLSGVSDMLNVIDDEVSSGAALRVYETKQGRMGLAVAEDLYFPEVIKALAVCGSDFIVCPFARADGVHVALLRAHAYCFGVPILFCADGYCAIADPSGNIAFASPQSPVCIDYEYSREYHLVQTRRRGGFR